MISNIALGLFALSVGYILFAIVRVLMFGRAISNPPQTADHPPVTVIKPMCGLEVDLAENLRSFCNQDYERFQIIFGVQSGDDPAIPVIREIMAEYPNLDLDLVIDDRIIGSNYKISNIANITEHAKHGILVMSDSDIRVGPTYLKSVVEPFRCANVGATTSLCTGDWRGGWASALSAMFINDWFLPSALIPIGLTKLKYCFGATIAVRSDAMVTAGGFSALADYLADDYMLGRLIHGAGYKVAFVPYLVESVMHEKSMRSAFLHELRWARTIRSLQPIGYAMSTITEILPISVLTGAAFLLDGQSAGVAAAPVCLALLLRLVLHALVSYGLLNGRSFAPWLVPIRDAFSLAVRITGFCGNVVIWRGNAFTVMGDNRIQMAKAKTAAESLSSPAAK